MQYYVVFSSEINSCNGNDTFDLAYFQIYFALSWPYGNDTFDLAYFQIYFALSWPYGNDTFDLAYFQIYFALSWPYGNDTFDLAYFQIYFALSWPSIFPYFSQQSCPILDIINLVLSQSIFVQSYPILDIILALSVTSVLPYIGYHTCPITAINFDIYRAFYHSSLIVNHKSSQILYSNIQNKFHCYESN